jgi:hypothetical protein
LTSLEGDNLVVLTSLEGDNLVVLTSLEGDNLVVVYYLSACEIWPDMNGGLWWEGTYKRTILSVSTN